LQTQLAWISQQVHLGLMNGEQAEHERQRAREKYQ